MFETQAVSGWIRPEVDITVALFERWRGLKNWDEWQNCATAKECHYTCEGEEGASFLSTRKEKKGRRSPFKKMSNGVVHLMGHGNGYERWEQRYDSAMIESQKRKSWT
jgi:hypothetical protein